MTKEQRSTAHNCHLFLAKSILQTQSLYPFVHHSIENYLDKLVQIQILLNRFELPDRKKSFWLDSLQRATLEFKPIWILYGAIDNITSVFKKKRIANLFCDCF